MNKDVLALAVELENKRTRAMLNGDAGELTKILSNDLYYGHSGGYRDNKADYISKIKLGTYAYHKVETVVEKAVYAGNDAIMIHGRLTLEVNLHGVEKTMHSIYLAIWCLEDGVWRFLGHQTALKQNA
ncbi:nuclear transport factor 2 family protein [Mucilaginibacter lacusdianchii]|uniref:nuclear transport factor 2 family protein n=1 Tax=Mucilaginibacter lacusdianchii TaxID=2684211 RepID=UPI00131C5352|nr:nuclear transport factor 2 family protein [Mucilaginibacter sp. JXJ CY 39]